MLGQIAVKLQVDKETGLLYDNVARRKEHHDVGLEEICSSLKVYYCQADVKTFNLAWKQRGAEVPVAEYVSAAAAAAQQLYSKYFAEIAAQVTSNLRCTS